MTSLIPQILTLLMAIVPAYSATHGSLRLGEAVKYDLVEDGNFLKLVPRDGKVKIRPEHQFVYPGIILDPKTGKKILESYAFIGSCLPNQPDTYVVYQTEHIEKKRHGRRIQTNEWQYYAASASEQGIKEEQREIKRAAQLSQMLKVTQKLAKNGTCREIPGRNRKMDSSIFNLRSRMNMEEPDEEEQEKDSDATPKAIEKDPQDKA